MFPDGRLPATPAPSVGAAGALERLAQCHTRGVREIGNLRRLGGRAVDRDAAGAAAGVVRYFDHSARDHYADEEEDLFPALLESMAGSDATCLREMIEGLTAEHRTLEAAWYRLRPALLRIAAGETQGSGASVGVDVDDVEGLAGLYERHMAREDAELMPMAARLIADDELDRIDRAMRARRGIGADAGR